MSEGKEMERVWVRTLEGRMVQLCLAWVAALKDEGQGGVVVYQPQPGQPETYRVAARTLGMLKARLESSPGRRAA